MRKKFSYFGPSHSCWRSFTFKNFIYCHEKKFSCILYPMQDLLHYCWNRHRSVLEFIQLGLYGRVNVVYKASQSLVKFQIEFSGFHQIYWKVDLKINWFNLFCRIGSLTKIILYNLSFWPRIDGRKKNKTLVSLESNFRRGKVFFGNRHSSF